MRPKSKSSKSSKLRAFAASKSSAEVPPEVKDMEGLKKLIETMPAGSLENLSSEVKTLVGAIREGKLDSVDSRTMSKALKEASQKARLDVIGSRFPRSSSSPATQYSEDDVIQHEQLSRISEAAAKQMLELSDEEWKMSGMEKPDFSKPMSYDKLVELDKVLGKKGIKVSDFEEYLSKDELKLPEDFERRVEEDPQDVMRELSHLDMSFKEYPFIKEAAKARKKRLQEMAQEFAKRKSDSFKLKPGDLSKSLIHDIRKGKNNDAIVTFNDALTWDKRVVGFDPIDLTCINVILSIYCFNGDATLAMRTFDLIDEYAFKPNLTTYNAMVNLGAARRDDRLLMQWYHRLLESGLSPDSLTYNTIISCYSQIGDLVNAEKWFDEMKRKLPADKVDSTAYAHMIHMHGVVLDNVPEALNWAKRMLVDGVRRTEFSAQVIAELHRKVDAETTRKAEQKRKIEKETIQGQLMAAIKLGEQKSVDKIWDSMRYNRAHITELHWSSMIAHYATAARLEDAVRLFKEMQDEGVPPSRITCGVMVQVYRRLGEVEEAQRTLEMTVKAPLAESSSTFEEDQRMRLAEQLRRPQTQQQTVPKLS